MKRSEVALGLMRIPVDALAVTAALLLSYRLREAQMDLIPYYQFLDPATSLPPMDFYLRAFVFPSIGIFAVVAAVLGLYALRSTRGAWSEVGGVIIASLLWLVAVMGWFFFVQKQLFYSRILLFHAIFFITLFSAAGRLSLVLFQRALLACGIGSRLVVTVGKQFIAPEAKETLQRDVRYRYLGHLPDLGSLRRNSRTSFLDLVIQTDPHPAGDETIALIDFCRSRHIRYAFLPPVFADVPHQLRIERLGMVPMLCFQPTPLDGWGRIAKRLFDFIVSIVLLIILSPILLLLALGVLIDSGWPVLYISRRVGEHARRRIAVLKFRSMICDADARKEELKALSHRNDGPLFKVRNDPRVTRFGKFLRRWSLDELPQLLNVLVGEMSLVGPRPHLMEEVDQYSPFERRVFAVKPGITGLAQVTGRSNLKFGDEVKSDLQYVEEWSMFLDLWILWRTIFAVLKRDGAD
ncbi:MAG: exopolysaccharide biosynthesis polyprenyl glycosylphosphotransferase [Candidatus Peribacteraceae bacterium]|nr:exopolysaccharide biosynthesis polyprenyl glycosylphosphotransferase [Candidatus Peribacteraceae bacterium]MDD5075257.1 exopolysaccharide biosynthesis polyprenyl glycosylphosphotransferase [Candidatus Peribacteraceae bacterium]